MNLASLSINRPTFISCIVILMLALGYLCFSKLGVDLFPDVTFPIVSVTTAYPGAGPAEIETLVSKPLEDEISSISGLKRLSSENSEGVNVLVAEFQMSTDIKYAEQQIRDRISSAKRKLPTDILEPVVRRIDPADQPILTVALQASLPEGQLFDLADQFVKQKFEQINNVGLVSILGGRKREIHVEVDREKLKNRELSVSRIVNQLLAEGENIPAGKVTEDKKDVLFRTLGEYQNLNDIKNKLVSFFGNDSPTTLKEVANIVDTLEDETSRAYVNGKKALILNIYKQSGSNTLQVVRDSKKQMQKINHEMQNFSGTPVIVLVRDGSKWIEYNVDDVKESIILGVILAVVVVYLFLGNGRSTIITGLALPNSLLGSFILMAAAGFTINIMTLLALSLSVGLLIDDAIVVRENIFRHIELGESPLNAAQSGSDEVRLAVIATTFAVLAVFGPMGFLSGVVGQFFRQFGLTVCFAMLISLFDALTIAPMLSAYFAGSTHQQQPRGLFSIWYWTFGAIARGFEKFQNKLENLYEHILHGTLKYPFFTLCISFLIFVLSLLAAKNVTKTFLPPQDAGEFNVSMDLPPGTSLFGTEQVAQKIDQKIRQHPEVDVVFLSVGNANGQSEVADMYVRLVESKKRKLNTIQFKDLMRSELKEFAFANIKVKDFDGIGAGQRPFNLHLLSLDQSQLDDIGQKLFLALKDNISLKDVDINVRPGKPEIQFILNSKDAQLLGVSTSRVGSELRGLIEGFKAGKFREHGREYDIRVRLKEDQRNLLKGYESTFVPNVNESLVKLLNVAQSKEVLGPANISRQDRARVLKISADIAANGKGMGQAIIDSEDLIKKIGLPAGMTYQFVGQAENFQELGASMALAMLLGILFIYLVLASLYESFVTPMTIMLALPLAICGSLFALSITGKSLDLFSMIGIIMLLGVATKNSILLVDYINQLLDQNIAENQAIITAGKTRLRPILMTTMALIAGVLPIALGLNEASKQRTSMGVAIIGGLISSTLLTLVVVPAAFGYIHRFKVFSQKILKKVFM